ncbi:uncharacterized protein LOC106176527 isoform X2 [Lingula anatina]|uniref:Uncharacterized protein LOC106176527 isoform X2 n=1 Tax=Lingula anatina TaxID=7574 RepID=A0A1S3JW48_LINAN|nr:uncharacterized protein LOC106176527 isoform X2 [Lingula anatina]|eukprot:XP_013414527.1 uncharacterized protein LOC106176527 isoform X2 [Lingula anatina]
MDGNAKMPFPSRIEGWLNVWVLDKPEETVLFENGNIPAPKFEPAFCVLLQEQHNLTMHRTEKIAEERCPSSNVPVLRLDEGKAEFDLRWGYEALESIRENSLSQTPKSSESFLREKSQTIATSHALSPKGKL